MASVDEGIGAYHRAQDDGPRGICEALAEHIQQGLPEAEGKVWHGGPVWFLDGNPVVGYWVRKNHVQLLFWSGQSFDEDGLQPEGTFKAAEARYTDSGQIDPQELERWLRKARDIQWDYKNLAKRKGRLERIENGTTA